MAKNKIKPKSFTDISKARSQLVLNQRFIAALLSRIKIKQSDWVSTMATDGNYIYYNEAFVSHEKMSVEKIKGVLFHEILHVVLQHHTRRGVRNPIKWNIAADYVINPYVRDAGLELPEGALFNDKYEGKSVEAVYNLLPDERDNGGGGGEGNGDGNGKQGGDDNGNNQGDGWNFGGVLDYPGEDKESKDGKPRKGAMTDVEIKEQEIIWKSAVQQAAQVAKVQGSMPAGMERLLDELFEPKINWREVMASFVTKNAKNDYNWLRPNKRYVGRGYYLPTLHSPEIGIGALLFDTSGSMGEKELVEVASEIQAALSAYGGEFRIIYVDATVAGYDDVTQHDIPISKHINIRGGGGTDFRPGFEWMEENDFIPDFAIYYTDGYCSSFPEQPDFPVLWVLNEKNDMFEAPFGETLVINK